MGLMKKLGLLFLAGEIIIFVFFLYSEIKDINNLTKVSFFYSKKEPVMFNPDEMVWKQAVLDAQWSERDAQTVDVFNNKFWLVGGVGGKAPDYSQNKSDIWSSADGENWELITDKAVWGTKRAHASVVFQGKIWLLGGVDEKGYINDVWYSSNGLDWVKAKEPEWTPRKGHSAVVFRDKIWIAGGVDIYGAVNDVWSSPDGENWELVIDEAQWSARYDLTLASFNNKLWLTGGVVPGLPGEKDVWSSDNGRDWELVVEAPWAGRHGHCLLVFKDYLWVLAGWDGVGKGYNDVWYSSDGLDWQELAAQSNWAGREDANCVVFDDKLWIMAGMVRSGARKNDVWYLDYGNN